MKPILFNTEMVRAILEGRKTVTRRVVKLPSNIQVQDNGLYTLYAEGTCYENQHIEELVQDQYLKAPYKVGDVLYVRETWSEWTDGYVYKAWVEPFPQVGAGIGTRWKPSIHMPKAAARIFLRVTSVRVERLRDIKYDECRLEGIIDTCYKCNCFPWDCDDCIKCNDPKEEFTLLWDSTIKPDQLNLYGWEANPYVWVIEFERVEKPEAAVQKEAILNVRE